MITFKCKMCGGDLEFEQGASVAECPYCGTTQTLPKLDDDKRANMYDRANHFRRQNEFDKAMSIYEQILQEDRSDAEAYWSLVLCRYGIEYVEDPVSHKRVPTVNRVQYASILADEDYKSALQYADTIQRGVYEAEANAIAEIQKGILDISKKEKPFDVFICYKETDANGRRTPDSVLGNDMYHQLTKEGFKVFFSRITLEDKIGTAYEPYIFAALNSAKVMVVLGTKPEYFNAVWVKNEWSRYLALIRAGADKTLVPAYRDMDPYDLPDEFAHLQAQDMGKLGFMQDLIRGIKKLAGKDEARTPSVVQQVVSGGANIDNLMRRARLFMEDGDWNSANEYLDKVLDENAEYAPAYAGKVQTQYKLGKEDDLSRCLEMFEESSNWKKAMRFATPEQRVRFEQLLSGALATREEHRKDGIYNDAIKQLNKASSPEDCEKAKKLFESIAGFRDADEKQNECTEAALNMIYNKAEADCRVAERRIADAKTAHEYERIGRVYQQLGDYRDSKEKEKACFNKAEAMRLNLYNSACKKLETDDATALASAEQIFQSLSPYYKDASDKLVACKEKTKALRDYEAAKKKQKELDGATHTVYTAREFDLLADTYDSFEERYDSLDLAAECRRKAETIREEVYSQAVNEYNKASTIDDYERVVDSFSQFVSYRDSEERATNAKQKIGELKAAKAREEKEREERLAKEQLAKEKWDKAKKIIGITVIVAIVIAVALYFLVLKSLLAYNKATSALNERKYDVALSTFASLKNYKDSENQVAATKEAAYNDAEVAYSAGQYDSKKHSHMTVSQS